MKTGLHLAGSVLAVAGIIFVAVRLHSYSEQIDFRHLGPGIWMVVSGCALAYGASNVMLALAWRDLLAQFGSVTTRHWAIRTYGLSQLAKYIPGNIFHLASRQTIGMAAGVGPVQLAKSSIWELGLIALMGTLFGALVLPLVAPILSTHLSVVAFLAAIFCAAAGLNRYMGAVVVRAATWQIGFLALSGIIFIALLEATAWSRPSSSGATYFAVCGAYVLAWLAGLVTPGAPAGLGVREIVLIFLLEGLVAERELLLAIVLGRVVTVIGDLLFFSITLLILKERNCVAV
jgi:hypothetical protein